MRTAFYADVSPTTARAAMSKHKRETFCVALASLLPLELLRLDVRLQGQFNAACERAEVGLASSFQDAMAMITEALI